MFKDAITPFYERLKRPFIGAFWISFLGVNWRVWTALFFYDQQVGGLDKIKYIEAQLTFCNTVIRPLCYSIIFLIIAPQIDYLAFWYQLTVRKQKRKKQIEFEKESPPTAETHLRVINERDEAKANLLTKERQVQELENELIGYKSLQHEVQELKYEPSISYFIGEWGITQPRLELIYFSFSATQLDIIAKNGNEFNETLLTLPISQLKKTSRSIIIPVINSKNDQRIEEMINWVKKFNQPSGDFVRFTNLFHSESVIYEVPILSIYKRTFNLYSNINSSDITLSRVNRWDESNYLFEGDEGKKYPIKN